MVMVILIIAVLAEIPIFFELLALLSHAYVDGFVRGLDPLLGAVRAIRQVVLILLEDLLELEEPLHGIILL
jgi:hypothetical protein